MFYGYESGNTIGYYFSNKKRIETGIKIILCILDNLFFKSFKTPDPAGPYNSYTILIHFFKIYSRIFDCFFGSNQSELIKPVQFSGFFPVKMFQRIKVFDFTSKIRFKL